MNVHTFLDNFATIADAPNGVRRLRDLVLGLAVNGRLIAQDPSDEPVESLLADVRIQRESLPKRRGMRAGLGAEARDTPSSRRLPPGWAELPLGDLTEIIRGITFPASAKHRSAGPDLVPCLRTTNVQQTIEWHDLIFVPAEYVKHESQLVRAGDVLMSMANSRELVGKVALVGPEPPRAAFGGFLAAIRPLIISPRFLQLVLQDPRAKATLIDSATQTTNIANISLGRLRPFRCPLPPLAEQRRIVSRVDELMGLCDELAARQQRRQRANVRFRGSALHALTEAATADDLRHAWERVTINWPDVTGDTEAVADVRQSIFDLAIEGRLVQQVGPGGSATAEIAQARATKASMEDLRRQPALPPAEAPAGVLPTGWIWATVDDLFLVTGGIQKSSKRRPQSNHWPYLRVANVQRGRLDLEEIERFELFDGELDRLRLQPGDLLVVEGNGSESEIGRCARWDDEIEDCVHQNHLIRCRAMLPGVEHYLLLFLNSPTGMETMKRLAVTTSGLYNLSVGKIRSICFPLPPLAEQERIRRRVDELLRSCDELSTGLAKQSQVRELLAASFIDAMGP